MARGNGQIFATSVRHCWPFQRCSTVFGKYLTGGNWLNNPHFGSSLHQTWWRHQMKTFSALLALCVENSPVPGEFSTQRPVTRSFDVFFYLHLNKPLSKQSKAGDLRRHWAHCDVSVMTRRVWNVGHWRLRPTFQGNNYQNAIISLQ